MTGRLLERNQMRWDPDAAAGGNTVPAGELDGSKALESIKVRADRAARAMLDGVGSNALRLACLHVQ